MNILALIPARGGSKGIPRKNIRLLGGKPLIAWTIEAALASTQIGAVVVSTDDLEIAEISRYYGAQVPFIRPTELAMDDTPGIVPVLHALDQLPQFDAVVLLQPTSPLRTTADIDACIRLAQEKNVPSVVSVVEPRNHPNWMFTLSLEQRLCKLTNDPIGIRRQDLPPVYALNGAVYYAHVDCLRRHNTFMHEDTLGYVMPKDRSLDIDTLLDWKMVELVMVENEIENKMENEMKQTGITA